MEEVTGLFLTYVGLYMKLLRFGALGQEKPGILDSEGHIRDLSDYIANLNPASLADAALLQKIQKLDPLQLPLIDKEVRIGACIDTPGKIVCIGFNSRAHAEEMGMCAIDETEMVVFMKPSAAVCGPFDPILHARHAKKLDWEAELAFVIGKKGKYIPITEAREHILGYLCLNDLSERYLQLETCDKQFTKGKCFDNSAPIGPYLVTKDEILDSSNLHIKLWVNDQLRQDFNTRDYIHNDEKIVSYLSQYFTLYPGDIISMGSAPGSARSWGEGQFLKPNDKVVFSIDGLGTQIQVVVSEQVKFR